MTKLTYDEWKEKYCAKINQEQLDHLKNTHGLEDPQNIIEQYNLEAYEKYVCQWLLGVKNNEET